MNICFFTNNYSYTGGIERVLSLISSKLAETNDVHIVSMYDLPTNNLNSIVYSKKVDISVLFTGNKKYIRQIIPAINELKKHLIEKNIDVVIATSEFVAPYAYYACKSIKTKCIVWTHTPTLNFDESIIQKPIKNFVFKNMDYIFTLTPESKENIINYFGRKEVTAIPNPIDPKLLNNKKYNTNSKRIITVGRICKQKNIEEAVKVAKLVLDSNYEWIWDIYGDGDETIKQQLISNINKYGLDNRINLKGNVSNLYEKYNDYSILVMTSKYEGFPMVLLEGIANRLPLVSYDISTGANLLIKDNGYLIIPFNTKEMADIIKELINNEEKRVTMSKESEKMIARYSINKISNIWIKELEKVIKYEK